MAPHLCINTVHVWSMLIIRKESRDVGPTPEMFQHNVCNNNFTAQADV